MISVGLDLTKFIDPSLTWKTVSRGRNTSRRSRRPASKTLTLDQNQGKRALKQLSLTESSESEKSDISIQGRGSGKMEHVPIKKRRFILRSPSPPPHSDVEQCNSESQSYSNGRTEPEVAGTHLSTGSVSKKSVLDSNVENTASSFDGTLVSSDDFSGIAMLAAAANSAGLGCTGDNAGKSKMTVVLKREGNESFASATSMTENIVIPQSTEVLGKAIGLLKEEDCVVDLPSNSIQSTCLENNIKDVGRNRTSELSRAETSQPVVSAKKRGESVKSCGLHDALNKDVISTEDLSSNLLLPIKGIKNANKTTKDSGVKKSYRLHWDLNTVMEEWDHPLDDELVDSSMQSIEIAQTSAISFKKSENKKVSTPSEIPLATDNYDRFITQPVPCVAPESNASLDCGGFNSVSTTCNKSVCCLDVSSCLGTSGLEGYCSLDGANSHTLETTSNGAIDSKTRKNVIAAEVDSAIDQSISLGMNETKRLVLDKSHDTRSFEILIKAAEESSWSTSQTAVSETDFSLLPLSRSALCEGKGVDHAHTIKGHGLTCQSVSTKSLGAVPCEIAGKSASPLGKLSFQANDADSGNPSALEHINTEEANRVPSKLKVVAELPTTIINKQAMDIVVKSEIEENPCTLYASRCDSLIESVPDVLEALIPVNSTINLVKHLRCNTHETCEDRDSRISSEVSSQVTESTANLAYVEREYDSHLEDGELREPIRHSWEDNKGDHGKTKHVDNDSDNTGNFSGAANDTIDFVRLSGEALGGNCVKHGSRLDEFRSADDDSILNKSVEENCSLQHQKFLSTADVKEAECIKRESPILIACRGAQLKGETKVVRDFKDCGNSDVEAHRPERECDYDVQRSCRSASASGRELQFSDRGVYTMKRSRSSNFDGMHQTYGSDESMQMDGGRSLSDQLKSDVGDSVPKDGEKIVRVQEDTPTKVCQPRIISTSQSRYNPMRRGSPVERDNIYDTGMGRGRGMVKGRDIFPDNNIRNRFDRFSNGINRGFREGYRRPVMYEDGNPNGPMLNSFGKRQRSFSPVENRMDSHFQRNHGKSRSRSRTRSPDFRPEARMGRTKLPYQQPERRSPVRVFNQRQRFDTLGSPGRFRSDDCMRSMIRPPRLHDTSTAIKDHNFEESDHYRRKPQFLRNNRKPRSRSRSYSPDFRPDARMGGMRPPYQSPHSDHVRGRRSPLKVFRQGQRYDNGDTQTGRVRSDDSTRPMMPPRRFSDNDYNSVGDEFQRKPRNIFERIHPIRNYDVDGDSGRLQYDEQDNHGSQNFRRNDNYVRGSDRRPQEGFRREERGNQRYYNSGRVFNSGPKQFGGMRDYADDTLPRGARP